MGSGFDIGRILEQYTGAPAAPPQHQVEHDFDEVAQNAPHRDLAYGLSEAFRSEHTPPFAEMVSSLFEQADIQQRTGMLNKLLSALGPSGIGPLLGEGGALSGIFNQLDDQLPPQLTPEQAAQLAPEQVREIATHAEKENPGVIDKMGSFFAHNPSLVKTLGGAALAIALSRMSRHDQ